MVDYYYDLGFIPHEFAVVIIFSMVCPSCLIELEFLMIFAMSVFKMGRDVVWFDFMGALCFAGATCRSEVPKKHSKEAGEGHTFAGG